MDSVSATVRHCAAILLLAALGGCDGCSNNASRLDVGPEDWREPPEEWASVPLSERRCAKQIDRAGKLVIIIDRASVRIGVGDGVRRVLQAKPGAMSATVGDLQRDYGELSTALLYVASNARVGQLVKGALWELRRADVPYAYIATRGRGGSTCLTAFHPERDSEGVSCLEWSRWPWHPLIGVSLNPLSHNSADLGAGVRVTASAGRYSPPRRGLRRSCENYGDLVGAYATAGEGCSFSRNPEAWSVQGFDGGEIYRCLQKALVYAREHPATLEGRPIDELHPTPIARLSAPAGAEFGQLFAALDALRRAGVPSANIAFDLSGTD